MVTLLYTHMHLNCCPCVVKVSKICKQVYWNKGKGKVSTRASWKWLGISLPPPGWDAHPSQGDLPLLGGERFCRRKVSYPRTQHINLTRSWTQTSSVHWPLGHCSSHKNTWWVNPLHPNISIHILHTVLYTFPKVLTRRICLPIKSFFRWWSFPLFSWPWCEIQGWYWREKFDAGHS